MDLTNKLKVGMQFEGNQGTIYIITAICFSQVWYDYKHLDDKMFMKCHFPVTEKEFEICLNRGIIWPKTAAGRVLYGPSKL